jgi:RND superfamily putative drug exporter
VLIATGVFLALAIAVVIHGGRLTAGEIDGLEAGRAEDLVEQVTGRSADTTEIVVFQFAQPRARAEAGAAIDRAVAPLRKDARVAAVVTPPTAGPLGARMVAPDGRTGYALVTLAGTFQDAVAAYPAVHGAVHADAASVTWTGRVAFQRGLDAMLERDLIRAELIALPVALLVLLLVFRSVVAAVLPVAVGGLAVLGGIACVLLLSHVMPIASYTLNVASLIGLGVAIDYSLFTVSRYREELAAGQAPRDALLRAMRTAGRVVAFAGLAVATGLFGLFVFRGSYLASMGLGGAIVVGLAVVFALTCLPALLAVLGARLDRGHVPLHKLLPMRAKLLRRLAWVIDHPWRVLVPTTLLLLVMAAPALRLRLVTVDETVLPPAAEARRGQALLAGAFPDVAGDRITIAVEFPSAPALTPARRAALRELTRRVSRLPGVAGVESAVDAPLPGMLVRDRVALVYALTNVRHDSDAARHIVRTVRADREVADGWLVVGGATANDLDASAYLRAGAPYAIAIVLGATLVILFLTFRSAVLPFKAIVLNTLSIGAALGATVWVFRELDPTVPILLFCILFGLSMDYHVLVLSRIREAYVHDPDHDNARAVGAGLARSAGLVTSAAAIMVAVFGAFALARFVVIRSVGFGMALAVALDATLVRVLLLPSAMKLLGDWNWWAPHLPRHVRRAEAR